MTALPRSEAIAIWLRPDDADTLLAYCHAILEQEPEPEPQRWVWWRIRQACLAALQAPEGCRDVVDRHRH